MTTIAVLGASSPLGLALLERLDGDPAVTHVVGVDAREPQMPVAKLEFRGGDARDPLLPQVLAGVDAIVQLPPEPLAARDDAVRYALIVRGTRNVLAAAARSGARRVVHVSTGMVYGAHPDNPFPLDETAPLRATPDFSLAFDHLLAEEFVAEWAAAHPERVVTVLRPATMLGPGVQDAVARHLESPRLPLVRGHEPPLQVVHVDDVAAAAHLAVRTDLPGAHNVAADGWLPTREACALLGRRPVFLPEEVALTLAARLWRAGLAPAPPGALPYLMHPWVLSSRRLEARGWAPARTNRDVLREFAAVHHGYVSVGALRFRRRDAAVAMVALGAAGLALAGLRRAGRGR